MRQALAADALRGVASERQAAYHAQHGAFADHWRLLSIDGDVLPNGIRVIIHHATADGWSASTSDGSIVARACVMWHGTIEGSLATHARQHPSRADEVVCDDFGR